jgi:hypothetical protein
VLPMLIFASLLRCKSFLVVVDYFLPVFIEDGIMQILTPQIKWLLFCIFIYLINMN